jgi:hypothetical protein
MFSFIILLILSLHVQLIFAAVNVVTITSSGTFGQYVQKQFGLANGGMFEIYYDVSQKQVDNPYNSYVLILVVSEQQRADYYDNLNSNDDSVSENINTLCTLPSMSRKVIQTLPETGTYVYTVSNNNGGSDLYTVLILQCRSSGNSNDIRAYVKVTSKNPDPSGNGYNQLPVEDVMLVRLYLGEIFIYTLMLMGIAGQIYLSE